MPGTSTGTSNISYIHMPGTSTGTSNISYIHMPGTSTVYLKHLLYTHAWNQYWNLKRLYTHARNQYWIPQTSPIYTCLELVLEPQTSPIYTRPEPVLDTSNISYIHMPGTSTCGWTLASMSYWPVSGACFGSKAYNNFYPVKMIFINFDTGEFY
jgi:hypothetical protein